MRHRTVSLVASVVTVLVSAVTLPMAKLLPAAAVVLPLWYVVLLVLGSTLFAVACCDAWHARSSEAGLLGGWRLGLGAFEPARARNRTSAAGVMIFSGRVQPSL